MKTVEEGYELFRKIKSGEAHFKYYWIDAVCACLFHDYDDSFVGYGERKVVREHLSYDALEKVESFEDFEALIARLKLELSVCE